MSLQTSILNAAMSLPEGGLLTPKEFLHLGSRAAVDQAFSRLVKSGKLLRIGRGLYTRPEQGRFGKRAPAMEKVLEFMSRTSGETIVPHGAATANCLGLSTQVPIQEVFLTSGPTRALTLGKRKITLKHAARWLLLLGDTPGGQVIRALAWLGEHQAGYALEQLRLQGNQAYLQELAHVRSQLPSWMAGMISQEIQYA